MRGFAIATLFLLVGCAKAQLTPTPEQSHEPDANRELTADQQVYQALTRLSFGPKPGDVARVRTMGVDRWIALQLAPDHIDDKATDLFVADHFAITAQAPSELETEFPKPGKAQQTDTVARKQEMMKRREITLELQSAKVARAVMSERQLQEVMVDFWENHFNIYAGKGGPEQYLLPDYDRTAIRPYALGRFRDLLGAVAHSPAMLFYLDNWESVADSGQPTLGSARHPFRAGKARGLNENYGRELLELHTLGVDGGYTQKDVIEVARALTGWSLAGPRQPNPGTFVFRPDVHDAGVKHVLGHVIAAGGGEEDGEQVLDIVAHHPSTAKFIARKLCIRFVSDSPPPALVDRAAATFTQTDGDIREVVRTIVTSPEFFSRAAYRSKVKTPFEVVTSALRALNAEPDSTPRSAQAVARLGEPLFGHQAPNGYAETGESWMNTGAILARINFGMAVAADRVPGVSLERWPLAAQLSSAPRAAQVDGVVTALLDGDASPDTHRILLTGSNPMLTQAPSQQSGLAQIVGLALGAPEFQRR
ncbi:MAG TPA: DUF1800 domain-containing protein [Gemmatimonadaceae bacterium]|nr:DUF1800 domain-containing protein [Gemmatimonadaceae bacterium]